MNGESGGPPPRETADGGERPGRPDESVPELPDIPEQGEAERIFEAGGRSWRARVAGVGLGGTGRLASATFVIVHFTPKGEQAARFEAFLPRGRFADLFDAELAQLLANAHALPPPER